MLGEIKIFLMLQNNEIKTTFDMYIIACLPQYSSQNGNNEIILFEEKGSEVRKQGKSRKGGSWLTRQRLQKVYNGFQWPQLEKAKMPASPEP
jgi:hypothetical protein